VSYGRRWAGGSEGHPGLSSEEGGCVTHPDALTRLVASLPFKGGVPTDLCVGHPAVVKARRLGGSSPTASPLMGLRRYCACVKIVHRVNVLRQTETNVVIPAPEKP